ncbi:hypothetical protein AB7M50_003712 [Bradyrhizobium elkanii]
MARKTRVRARAFEDDSRLSGKDAPAVHLDRRNEREHLISVYPLPDRHLTADGRPPVRRNGRLSAVAGRTAAASRLSDHPDLRKLAWRQPGNHGVLRRAAAGAAIRADSGHRSNDLDELARLDRGHHSVRSEPQHRRSRQRCSGGDQCRRRSVAQVPADAPDLPQGQPGGLAHPHIVGDLRHPAADQGERCGRRPARAADQPDFGRRPGIHRRTAEARDPRAGRSRQAGRQGALAGRYPQPDRHYDGRWSEGQHRRRDARLHDLRQRSTGGGKGLE